MRSIPPELAQRTLDAAPDAMLVIDGAGLIQFVNRQVSALFGYSHDEVIGRPVEQLMPQRFRGRHIAHRVEYLGASRVRPMGTGLELFAQRRDGSEFPVEISLSPVSGLDDAYVAASIRDVTARKRAEAELIEARMSADRANQAKSRFLATASHDLRQPLQALSLLNRTLRALATEPDAADALVQQERTITGMSRLLNALLDISKLESGAVQPEIIDFTTTQLFEELKKEFSAMAADKGLILVLEDCGSCVRTDPALVEELLRNLVSNAIKYTRKGFVRLRSRRDGGLVRIEVQDTGIGIASDQLALIFDEFYQIGVSANSAREGYGLGLSIVQRICSLLQLKLVVSSVSGEGSTFSINLPLGTAQVAALFHEPLTAAVAEPRSRKARVLLVEDEPAVRNATRLLLTVEGFSVTAVSSFAEARDALQTGVEVELLITDYHLKNGETGLYVIEELRRTLGPSLKALLITGDTSAAIRSLSDDANLQIISKPVNADNMLALLDQLLAS